MKKFKYTIDGKEYNVEIGDISEDYVADVKVNGEEFKVQMEKPAGPEKKKVELGKPAAPENKDDNSGNATSPVPSEGKGEVIKAPLPGTITSIDVSVGQEVKAGDTLVVLEAMKMANNIEAEKDGKVTAICVKNGQSVMEDDPLVVVE